MTAAKLNLTVDQGATFRHCLVLKAGSGPAAPEVNLTGYSVRLQIRAYVSAPDVLLELSTANGRIVVTPLTGEIAIVISATDTGLLDFSKAVYVLEIESAGGEVARILQGVITLSKGVAR